MQLEPCALGEADTSATRGAVVLELDTLALFE